MSEKIIALENGCGLFALICLCPNTGQKSWKNKRTTDISIKLGVILRMT